MPCLLQSIIYNQNTVIKAKHVYNNSKGYANKYRCRFILNNVSIKLVADIVHHNIADIVTMEPNPCVRFIIKFSNDNSIIGNKEYPNMLIILSRSKSTSLKRF